MPDVDALAELNYAAHDPQFAPDEDMINEETYESDLESLSEMLWECRTLAKNIREIHRTRKTISIEEKLKEAEEAVDELIEKG